MRAVVLLVLLVGCSQPAVEPPGPEEALFGKAEESLHLLGPPAEDAFDRMVVPAQCQGSGNVLAYNLSTPDSSMRLTSVLGMPHVTSFVIATFARTAEGLAPTLLIRGGSSLHLAPMHEAPLPGWREQMPDDFTLSTPEDHTLLVIACAGDGAINYVVNTPAKDRVPEAPLYLDATVASGFDPILAYVSDDPLGATTWSRMGNVLTQYEQQGPPGLRVGETVIRWSSKGPGWSMLECGHYGISDHGTWKYDADLHAGETSADGFVMQDPLTLYGALTQVILFGNAMLWHVDEGDAPGHFRLEVEHDASMQFSRTHCQGVHLGATLEQLFGVPAAKRLDVDNGLVQPSTMGGWPLDD